MKYVNKTHNDFAKTIQNHNNGGIQLDDNRPSAFIQRKQVADLANKRFTEAVVQKKTNTTGLPDQLKSGIENLSGHAMDDVKVHYNSSQPAQLNAHAYAQGNQIHLAPGQEKHLPHEAWHVAQQKQGRVKPTMQMKGKVNINDDKGLEKEADVMGAKALGAKPQTQLVLKSNQRQSSSVLQGMFEVYNTKYTENAMYGLEKEKPNALLVKKGAAPPVPGAHFMQVGEVSKDLVTPQEHKMEDEGGKSVEVPLIDFDVYVSNKKLQDKLAKENPNDCGMFAKALHSDTPSWKDAKSSAPLAEGMKLKADYHPGGFSGASNDPKAAADIGEMYIIQWEDEHGNQGIKPEDNKDFHHAATVVAKDGEDHITCEANAGKELAIPEFEMYGGAKNSFYEVHKDYFTRKNGSKPYLMIFNKHGVM